MKLVYHIDWLSLTYKTDRPVTRENPPVPPPGWSVSVLKGTNLFKNRFYLTAPNGTKVLTLLSEPYSAIISPDCLLVEVANPLLYSGMWEDALYNVLPSCCRCSFNNIHRLDLCADFECGNHEKKILRGLAENSLYVQGKRSQVLFTDIRFSSKVERDLTQISWGSKQSEIKIKVYNKWKELSYTENGQLKWDKPYIVEQWLKEGMVKENVWRWEVSLTKLSSQEFYGLPISLDRIQFEEYWHNLLFYLYHQRFVVRKNEGNENKSRDSRIKFLEVPEPVDNEKSIYHKKEPQGGHVNYSMVTILNHMMRDFGTIEMRQSSSNKAMAGTICQIVKNAGLHSYL